MNPDIWRHDTLLVTTETLRNQSPASANNMISLSYNVPENKSNNRRIYRSTSQPQNSFILRTCAQRDPQPARTDEIPVARGTYSTHFEKKTNEYNRTAPSSLMQQQQQQQQSRFFFSPARGNKSARVARGTRKREPRAPRLPYIERTHQI